MRYYKHISLNVDDFRVKVIYYEIGYGIPYKLLKVKFVDRIEVYEKEYGIPQIKTGTTELTKEQLFLELL